MEEQLSGRAIKRRRAKWKAQARREWEPQACLDAVMSIYEESGKPISVRDQAKIKRLKKALEKLKPAPTPVLVAPAIPAAPAAETPAPVAGDSGACRWCGELPDGTGGQPNICGSHFRRTRDDGTEYFASGLFDCDDMLRLIEKNIPRWAEEDAKKAAEVQQ